ncbi:hypothetical protein VNPA120661_43120 [Pseudomonas aeruginosa]|jgi:hypothetical protein|nr:MULTISPECIES: hypothetical protein [Pseudomonas aeruginosa group]QZH54155.1 hypothetical protein K5A80_35420 [Pseudomonas aeruginosa]GLE83992.1 hypothetical protein VNPA120661_43120 [Pseudomonas aeruginosa]
MMKNRSITIRTGLLAAAIALLVGCSSAPKAPTVELPDPKDVPKEKWSDAMHVLTAMRISGQRDVPHELASSGPTTATPSTGGSSAADAAVAAGGSPGISSNAALGLGVGLFLLGGSSDPVRGYQTAAWVPSTLVKSPEEASDLVLKLFDEARLKAFPNKRSTLTPKAGKYPAGSGKAYADPMAIWKETPVPFDGGASTPPSFVAASEVYGPIFIHNGQYTIDANKNDISTLDAMIKVSEKLPEWFFMYHPGERLRKNSIPARIINKGQSMYFVGK